MTNIGEETFVLMPTRRTFTKGLSGVVDFSDLKDQYATSDTEKEADLKAIAADWRAVGKDIEIAYVWGKQQAGK